MKCCTPNNLLLALNKPTLNYQNIELYDQNINQIIKNSNKVYTFSKSNSLEFDINMNPHFKTHHDTKAQFLFELCDASQEITMNYVDNNNEKEIVWRILTDKETHVLQVGDKIKIGLTEFYVYSRKDQQKDNLQKEVEQESKTAICRYCHSNSFSKTDPLISLCKCRGSMEFMHVQCLRNWIMMKADLDYKDNQIFYMFKEFKCQICKQQWPSQYFHSAQYHPLLNFQTSQSEEQEFDFQQDSPYLVLQTNSLDEDDIEMLIFIKINLDVKFNIGDQTQDVNLILDGFGVSPTHCSIELIHNQIYITDNGSQMGTLINLYKEQTFTTKRSILMQYCNIILQIKIEQPSSFLSCFLPEMQYKLKFRTISHKYKSKNDNSKQFIL